MLNYGSEGRELGACRCQLGSCRSEANEQRRRKEHKDNRHGRQVYNLRFVSSTKKQALGVGRPRLGKGKCEGSSLFRSGDVGQEYQYQERAGERAAAMRKWDVLQLAIGLGLCKR
jgi:hypothetical protein